MNNHLIIGLGGTGGRIIRAFRKIVYQAFRNVHPEGVNIAYLYVDSDAELMTLDDPSWKILGHCVQLGIDSQLPIQGADLNDRLNHIHSYPGIQGWIGNQEDWRDILRSFAGGRIYGGQKRRLGRFLLACNISAFVKQLSLQVNNLQTHSNQAEVTFHICCGLAGGTGSGSIIDTIAQIRKFYPYNQHGTHYTILVYTYLPEKNPNPKWDTGNYQANGYAALLELNALSAGRFDPYDILEGGRLRGEVAFNGMYLFTNQNERNVIINVEQDVPHIMADFLYQKIVAVRNLAWNSLNFLEDAQNGDSTPETAPLPESRIPERAKRFLAFGINRVAIPEEEIKEYLTYHFARQVALQLKFNHWNEGFVDYPAPHDLTELVERPATQSNWWLTDEHLTLSKGILATDIDKKWLAIDEEWRSIAPHFQEISFQHPKPERLEQLEKLFQKRFEQDFRSRGLGELGGVDNFYRLKSASRQTMAKAIRQKIESDLFTQWQNGTQSVHDLGELITALIHSFKMRKKKVQQQQAFQESQVKELSKQVASIRTKWQRRGLFTNTVILLDKQTVNLRDWYTARTWLVALHFADQLLDELINEMNTLVAQLEECANIINQALKEFEAMCDQRLQTELVKQVRLYESERVKTVAKLLISDEPMQRTYTTKVREEIVKRLGNQLNFTTFNKLGAVCWLDLFIIESAKNVQIAHDKLIQNPKDRLFGVSIVEKLKERYENDTYALRMYVAELVRYACNYLSFDNAEIQKTGLGIPTAPTQFSRFTVILPKTPLPFVTELKNAFRQSYSGEIEFLESDTHFHEIVMIHITNLFPLRFVSQVGFLRQKYLARISRQDAARVQLELHLEGDGSQFPSLFVPAVNEMKAQTLPYLLLAKAMGLVVSSPNENKLIFITKDSDGFYLAPVYLGESLVDSYLQVELTHLEQMRQQVNKLLENFSLEQRQNLKAAILQEVNRIEGNITDEVLQRFNEAGRAAVRILKSS